MRKSILINGAGATAVALTALLALPGCTAGSAGGARIERLRTDFPVVHYHGATEPATVSFQRSRPGGWVPLAQVSSGAIGAVIVSEDWAFYQHQGIDPKQIQEALKHDMEEGRYARGASTITQQVVRNLFLDQNKNLLRKLKEVWLAVRLEKIVPKKKILETYLNIAEWGEGIYGVGAASAYYFQKAPSGLSAKEGAFLAMLLPSPKRYSQSFRAKHLTEYASETVGSILDKMVRAHYLLPEDREFEGARKLSFESSPTEEADGPGNDSPAVPAPVSPPASDAI